MSDSPKSRFSTQGKIRWAICALLFFALTINYLDRLVFGVVAPELQKIYGWSNADYTNIAFWFEVAYGIGLSAWGCVIDRVGGRSGLAASLTGWSVALMVHTIMRTIAGFSFARFALGLTESAVFPAIVKIVAEWFPRKERALVMGILNSGSNIAAIIAPIVVPWLFVSFGWRWAFWGTGAIGFLWLLCWLWFYRTPDKHPRLSAGERAYIQSDPPEAVQTPISWKSLLTLRQTWAFIAAKFFTDAVWRWNLYLLPLFFHQVFKLDIRNFGLPFVTIYAMADVGSICGGWFSSSLLKRGYSINAARKTAMLVCALCVVPVVCAPLVPQMYVAVFVVGLASAAHQGFSTNIFTTVSDMFPKQAVASVTGIGGTAGALGAMLLLGLTSRLFEGAPADPTRVYCTLFAIASVAYLLGLGIMHVLAPKMRPVAPSDLESPQVDTP